MKNRKIISEYFEFSRRDRIGITVLVFLIIIAFIAPHLEGRFVRPAAVTLDSTWIKQLSQSLEPDPETENSDKRYKTGEDALPGSDFNDRTSNKRFTPTIGSLFYFDPNKITDEEWRKLGVRDKTIQTIRKYLSRGGHFYKAADLGKVYGLQYMAEKLIPWVRMDDAEGKGKGGRFGREADENGRPSESGDWKSSGFSARGDGNRSWSRGDFPRKGKDSGTHSWSGQPIKVNDQRNSADARWESTNRLVYPRKLLHHVDINKADTAEFSSLPGIGSKLAARIVGFREKLGGFYSSMQISETFGLADSVFQKLKPFLQVKDAAVRKIDINMASLEELKSHPYIRGQMAMQWLNYRKEHGSFKSLEEVKSLVGMSEVVFQKLQPYLMK